MLPQQPSLRYVQEEAQSAQRDDHHVRMLTRTNSINFYDEIASQYQKAFENEPIQLPVILPDVVSAYHLYIILLPIGVTPLDKSIFFDAMLDAGVGVNVHYIPIHTQPYYKALGFRVGDFPVAEDFYSRAISLPLFPTLKDYEINQVIISVKALMG